MHIAADCSKYIPTTLRGCSIILLITFHIPSSKGVGGHFSSFQLAHEEPQAF